MRFRVTFGGQPAQDSQTAWSDWRRELFGALQNRRVCEARRVRLVGATSSKRLLCCGISRCDTRCGKISNTWQYAATLSEALCLCWPVALREHSENFIDTMRQPAISLGHHHCSAPASGEPRCAAPARQHVELCSVKRKKESSSDIPSTFPSRLWWRH